MDITLAKKTVESLADFNSDPQGLYIECDKNKMSLSEYLESKDPSDINPEGERVSKYDAFDRVMMAMDVKLSGTGAFTLEKLMSTGTEMMVPELIKREVEAGMAMGSTSYKDLVATEVPTDQSTYHPIYIPDQNLSTNKNRKDKSLSKRASIAKGGEFARFSLRHREKDVIIGDYGRVIEAPYSMLKGKAWPDLKIFFQILGAQIAVDKMFDIYDLGISGDGTVGAATDLFDGTSGTLSYADLVHAYTAFGEPFVLNAFMCPQQSHEAILTMPQFQDPLSGWEFQKSGKPVTPMGAVLKEVGATPGGTPTGTVIVAIDKRFAIREVISQGLMVESSKIIERKFEQAVISEESAFSIIADGAIHRIVWT